MSGERGPATTHTPGEDEIRAVLERARGGDLGAQPAFRQTLDAHPQIWQAYGDLAAHAQRSWVELIGGSDLALKASLDRKLAAMKAELGGPDPSPLEALLVERIVACWLQAYHADAAASQVQEMSIPQGHYLRKRQDSAHRRYLSAVATLATTRRLLGSAAGVPGATAKISSAPTVPARVIEGDPTAPRPAEDRATPEASDREGGLVLEFRPPHADVPGGGQPCPDRNSRCTSRS
jgi:hypothetical protein